VNEVNIPSGIESNNVIKLFVGHVEPVYMVDNEPIVDNSEICRSIASIDESRIWATAIIESGTIIGYYYNNNINPTRSEEEQPEIKGTELQNIIRSTGDQLADTASTTSTNLTRSMHLKFLYVLEVQMFLVKMLFCTDQYVFDEHFWEEYLKYYLHFLNEDILLQTGH
jgi:hypothetical protein